MDKEAFEILLGSIEKNLCKPEISLNKLTYKQLDDFLKVFIKNKNITALELRACETNYEALNKILQQKETLQQLSLVDIYMGDGSKDKTGIKDFFSGLKKTNIHTLNLSNNELEDEVAKELAITLKDTQIHTLNLSKNKIGDKFAINIACSLEENIKLNSLDLSENRITYIGMQSIALALKQNKNLHSLYLGKNYIGYLGLKFVYSFRLVCSPEIYIGDLGFLDFASSLKENVSLLTLELGDIQSSENGTKHLFAALKENKVIYSLKLNKASFSNPEDINLNDIDLPNSSFKDPQDLANLFKNNTLRVINLSQFNQSPPIVFQKSLKIAEGSNFYSLDLSYTKFRGENISALFVTQSLRNLLFELTKHSNLHILKLNGVERGSELAIGIAQILKKNKNLHTLELSSNYIRNPEVSKIAEALMENRGLRTLHLDRNPIGNSGAKKLISSIRNHKKLNTLEIDCINIDRNCLRSLMDEFQNSNIFTLNLTEIGKRIGTIYSYMTDSERDLIHQKKKSDTADINKIQTIIKNKREKAWGKNAKEMEEILRQMKSLKSIDKKTFIEMGKENYAQKYQELYLRGNELLSFLKEYPFKGDLEVPWRFLVWDRDLSWPNFNSEHRQKSSSETKNQAEIRNSRVLITNNERKTETERVMLTKQELELQQSMGIQMEEVPILKKQLSDWSSTVDRLKQLENQLAEVNVNLLLDPQTKAEQAYIDERPKLKGYQHRVQKELSCFITCYFIAPAGWFKLEDNAKDIVISAIGSIPLDKIPMGEESLAAVLLKAFTAVLSYLNKRDKYSQINRLNELFNDLNHINYISLHFARKLTLAKEQSIEAQKETVYTGLSKVKGLYCLVKEALEVKWKGLALPNSVGVSYTPQDKLAVLDIAYLLQQILMDKVKIDKTRNLEDQFIKIVTNENYTARQFNLNKLTVSSSTTIESHISVTSNVSSLSMQNNSHPVSDRGETEKLKHQVEQLAVDIRKLKHGFDKLGGIRETGGPLVTAEQSSPGGYNHENRVLYDLWKQVQELTPIVESLAERERNTPPSERKDEKEGERRNELLS